MASGRTKRRGKVMERHSTKTTGAVSDEPCTEVSSLKGGGGASGGSAGGHESTYKMQLMIGDLPISINAEPPSPLLKTLSREAGENGLFHLEYGADASQQQTLQSDNFPSDIQCCPLCSKPGVSEPSNTSYTYHAETCKHEFCTDCYTNHIKGSVLRLSFKSTTLEDVTSALQCPVAKCGEQFTYLDIKQALGSAALHQFQDVIVGLFSRMFGASWRKECPQCSSQEMQAALVRATDLENLSLPEVYSAMEAWGLPVSGRSKEQGIQDLESVTGSLVASPWRLMCLSCDCVQCESCGVQVKGPTSPSSGINSSSDCTIEDFGIILQGREITNSLSSKLERGWSLPIVPAAGTTHRLCDENRKQCFSVFCAAMEIGLAQTVNKRIPDAKWKSHTKDSAVWPADGGVSNIQQQTGVSLVLHSDKASPLPCASSLSYNPLNMVMDSGVSESTVPAGVPNMPSPSVGDMLKILLPTVKSDLPLDSKSGKEQESSILESLLPRPGFGAEEHPVMLMIPSKPVHTSTAPPLDIMSHMNDGSILHVGTTLTNYWSMKAATWMQNSNFWIGEAERFSTAAEWWDTQSLKWAGRADDMAQKASNWANNEAYWAQSAERLAAANKLWGYKIQEMSQLCTNFGQSGVDGLFHPELVSRQETVELCPPNPPVLEVTNLRTRSDLEEYADSLGADTEWISPVDCEVDRWSTASNASVPSTSLNSSPNTRGSSLFGLESGIGDGYFFPDSKMLSLAKSTDEKLMNALWDLSNSLEMNAHMGVNLCAPAAYFLWGFESIRIVLCSLLQNKSLPDVMYRESLYSEVFFLLRAISADSNIVPILFMPNSVNPAEGNMKGSVFDSFKNLHQQAEDMLSEALVKVENDHEATKRNVNLIGDMEDAFEIIQGSVGPSFSSWVHA